VTYIAAISGWTWIIGYGNLPAKIIATIAATFWLARKLMLPLFRGDEKNNITIETPGRILTIANRIAAAGGTSCTVRIVDSKCYISNASHFTYTITLSSGLINYLTDDELAMVIAHEVAHVKNGPVRFINPLFGQLRAELEADRKGFLIAMKAGFDSKDALSAVTKSGSILSGNAFDTLRKFLFYKKPLISERINLIKSLIVETSNKKNSANSGDTILNSADKVREIIMAHDPDAPRQAVKNVMAKLGHGSVTQEKVLQLYTRRQKEVKGKGGVARIRRDKGKRQKAAGKPDAALPLLSREFEKTMIDSGSLWIDGAYERFRGHTDVITREYADSGYDMPVFQNGTDNPGMGTYFRSPPTVIAAFLEHVGIKEGDRLLELGSGGGHLACFLSKGSSVTPAATMTW